MVFRAIYKCDRPVNLLKAVKRLPRKNYDYSVVYAKDINKIQIIMVFVFDDNHDMIRRDDYHIISRNRK